MQTITFILNIHYFIEGLFCIDLSFITRIAALGWSGPNKDVHKLGDNLMNFDPIDEDDKICNLNGLLRPI